MEDLISIIVPVYKVENYLERCVRSLRAQTYQNIEIILVDDGSPDKCPELCDGYAEQDARIRVIHKKNGGLSDARNYGTDAANGSYIIYVDSDDWVHPQMAEVLLYAAKTENAEIVVGNFCKAEFVTPFSEFKISSTEVITPRESHRRLYNNDAFITAWGTLLQADIAKQNLFPVGKIHEDEFTTYKFYASANRIVWLDAPLYYYFCRQDSIMNASFSVKRLDCLEALRGRLEYFDKQSDNELVVLTVRRYVNLSLWMLEQIKGQQAYREKYEQEYAYLKNIAYKYEKTADLNMKEFGYLFKEIDSVGKYAVRKMRNMLYGKKV